MYPVIIHFGPFTIYSYGVMMAVAFFVSTILCLKEKEVLKINRDTIINLSLLTMLFGILGARITHILFNLEEYRFSPLEAIKIHRGGLVLYGGIAGGLISGLIYLKRKKLSVLKTMDGVFPFVSLGESITRIGCFLNGCCYGKESLFFGFYFPVYNKILIPTQLYSSLGNLLIYLILRYFYKKKRFDGQIILLYFILYPLKRFLMDFLRADTEIIIFNLTLLQILNLFILIISLIIFFRCKRLISA